ncbi:MAG: methylmalonyl Co-A mutase-associated GTPase MeaB [Bdellovibrionales bacterium]|nr:methylmalonyl Co-A mutase-associated GTPase MeaB [Bdellovibrionales bacterium]
MSDQKSELFKNISVTNQLALAKALTYLERTGPQSLIQFPELLSPTKKALRIGITGPPGAGKSTLIGHLINELRSRHLSIGVLAIDPSSPFSRGAILGDRIRYSDHFNDDQVFIRSLGTRGSLGGLCSSAYLMLRAYDLAGFDVVLIETVGVGQTELEIMNVADSIVVVLVPESGDSIQAMKAGLLEIADIYVVNKSDRPGADAFTRELQAQMQNPSQKIINTVATESKGIIELADAVTSQSFTKQNPVDRIKAEAKALLRTEIEQKVDKEIENIHTPDDLLSFFK